MKYIGTFIGKTPKGKFKVYIWGQPDYHIMDWSGCNYRYLAVGGQPARGFDTFAQALTAAKKLFHTEARAREYAGNRGDGTFMSDAKFKSFEMKDVKWSK